jgi:predicted RNA-binding Zn-ribbon protein involved in translation (DUF1610 family)
MKIECENCGEEFDLEVFGLIGPEGATNGLYQDGRSTGFLYNPKMNVVHPFCPECGFVNVDVGYIPEEIGQ